MQFPDDANGDMLQLLVESGLPLDQPTELDFYLFFKHQDKAEAASEALAQTYHAAQMALTFDNIGQWELQLKLQLPLNYQAIADMESQLEAFARKSAGKYDGWGAQEPE